jgi:hypothetical protein
MYVELIFGGGIPESSEGVFVCVCKFDSVTNSSSK